MELAGPLDCTTDKKVTWGLLIDATQGFLDATFMRQQVILISKKAMTRVFRNVKSGLYISSVQFSKVFKH